MQIIGAGLPRTATLTLKIALEMLGAGPCYHMVTVMTEPDRTQHWIDAYEGRADWGKTLDGFAAIVDYPGAYFYREIMAAYPDAKVILTVRDGESWARSMHDTIWGAIYGDTLMHHLAMAQATIDPVFNQYVSLIRSLYSTCGLLAEDPARWDAALSAAAFGRYNDEVRASVPAGKLLVWSPADGWEPLCAFVGAPVPPVPLPVTNDAKGFEAMIVGGCMTALDAWHAEHAPAAAPVH